MSLHDIQCCGKSLSLFMRQKCDISKKLGRRIFSPIQQTHIEQQELHEIANHYKDFKRKRVHREHRRRQSYPAKYLSSLNKRLSLTSTREILQMPCFVFPRFGKNFPWRGRQTICNRNTTKIECKTLQKINSATEISDFAKLFQQTSQASQHLNHSGNSCISTKQNSYKNPLTCHIKKVEILSDRKPVTSTTIRTPYPLYRHQQQHHRKGRTRYNNIATKVGGFDDETENLEWYIELASRCYNEGFQWHMNYLNDCNRRSALLKRRRLTGAATKFNRIAHRTISVDEKLTPSIIDEEINRKIGINDKHFRENIQDCKIRININQSLNSNLNNNNNNKQTIKKDLKLKLSQRLEKGSVEEDEKSARIDLKSTKSPRTPISPRSPLSNSSRTFDRTCTLTHQTSKSSQIDVVDDRKALRDALYQGIFHRHRRTIFFFSMKFLIKLLKLCS